MSLMRRVFESVNRGSVRRDIQRHIDSWRQDHRRLAANPYKAKGTHSSARVNRYASELSTATAYLEIGVEHGYTLEAVRLSTRVGVDPHPQFSLRWLPAGLRVHPTTSDRFFETLGDDIRFDVVFIDGLHTYQQTYRDLINSLRHLQHYGVIIIDDVVPSDEISAMSDLDASVGTQIRMGGTELRWHGDVFRVIAVLRDHHPELQFRTIVGAGNEQTLLWKFNELSESAAADPETLAKYSHVSYEEIFRDGVPAFFMPGSEEDVFREFKQLRNSP